MGIRERENNKKKFVSLLNLPQNFKIVINKRVPHFSYFYIIYCPSCLVNMVECLMFKYTSQIYIRRGMVPYSSPNVNGLLHCN